MALLKIIPQHWTSFFKLEINKPYFKALDIFLNNEKQIGKTFYPFFSDIFKALEITAFENIKVVIIGQDPYHGTGEANGLSFSVNKGVKIPPSLKYIFKELSSDILINSPSHGDLTKWAQQGVLLLNSILTVIANKPGSHQKKGWEQLTDKLIETISNEKENIVFILCGKYAQSKSVWINEQKHLVLKVPHPSPFSAHTGFLGSKPFSKTNAYLVEKGLAPIDWQLID